MQKYYKTKMYETIRTKDLLPQVRKLLHKDSYSVFVTFDLSTNKITLNDMYHLLSFSDVLKTVEQRIPKPNSWQKIKNKFYHFLTYKLKIKFRANAKALQSELIKQVGVAMLTKPNSTIYKEAKTRYGILYAIIHDKHARQPVSLMGNCTYGNPVTYFLGIIGRMQESRDIWDCWMKSGFDNSARKKFKKMQNKKLLEMIQVL